MVRRLSPYALPAAFSLLYFAAAFAMAAAKPFWFDEIGTFRIVEAPSLAAMLSLLSSGVEPHPPLSYLLLRLARSCFGSGELAMRLPSILAFYAALVGIYRFLSYRMPREAAIFGCVIFSVSTAHFYATEARGYALLLAGTALATASWQRERYGLLAASLALAVSSHYYAVLAAPVLLAAEFTRSGWRLGRLLASLAAGFSPLLILAPWIAASMHRGLAAWHLNPNNIAAPSLGHLTVAILDSLVRLVIPLLIGALGTVSYLRGRARRPSGLIPAELTLAWGLLSLVLIAFAISSLLTGVYFPRYALAWNIGLAILIAAWFAKLDPRPSGLLLAAGLTAATPFLLYGAFFPIPYPAADITSLWRAAARPSQPLVYADPLYFRQLAEYAPPDLRARLTYLPDPAQLAALEDPVPEDTLVMQNSFAGYALRAPTPFLAAHPEFLLLASGDQRREWLPARLRAEGYTLIALGQTGSHVLYRVTVTSPAPKRTGAD